MHRKNCELCFVHLQAKNGSSVSMRRHLCMWWNCSVVRCLVKNLHWENRFKIGSSSFHGTWQDANHSDAFGQSKWFQVQAPSWFLESGGSKKFNKNLDQKSLWNTKVQAGWTLHWLWTLSNACWEGLCFETSNFLPGILSESILVKRLQHTSRFSKSSTQSFQEAPQSMSRPDVRWDKPFKDFIAKQYDDWVESGSHEVTKGGNPNPPAYAVVVARDNISNDMIKKWYHNTSLL